MIITNHQSLCVPFNEFQDQDISGSFSLFKISFQTKLSTF